MNWAELKDSVSHICPAGTLIASWPLAQEVAEYANFESFYCNDIFVTEFSEKTFRENQGSHSTWKTWKNESTPGKPGNIMEF